MQATAESATEYAPATPENEHALFPAVVMFDDDETGLEEEDFLDDDEDEDDLFDDEEEEDDLFEDDDEDDDEFDLDEEEDEPEF